MIMVVQNAMAPDALKAEDWAGEMGGKWLANLYQFEGMIAPIGNALLTRANYQPGERVLDIGSGGGATTLSIAGAVGPTGSVLGIDISPDLTEAATARAELAGVGNARFLCADAGTASLADASYDRLFSRFGSMFFADPIAAFTNLYGLLRTDGRIDLAVWAAPRDNLWMMELMGVVRNYVDIPPAVPRTPGPFAFEDLDYLREILAASGFGSPDIIAYEGLQPVGGHAASPIEAAQFALSSMAVGRVLEAQGADTRERAKRDLTELFTKHYVRGKGVMMVGKAWLVSAIC
jgi:ubiquinone/menaquinone biosynthesis C-methylase UbiE